MATKTATGYENACIMIDFKSTAKHNPEREPLDFFNSWEVLTMHSAPRVSHQLSAALSCLSLMIVCAGVWGSSGGCGRRRSEEAELSDSEQDKQRHGDLDERTTTRGLQHST